MAKKPTFEEQIRQRLAQVDKDLNRVNVEVMTLRKQLTNVSAPPRALRPADLPDLDQKLIIQASILAGKHGC